jgi:hypothetical protein
MSDSNYIVCVIIAHVKSITNFKAKISPYLRIAPGRHIWAGEGAEVKLNAVLTSVLV